MGGSDTPRQLFSPVRSVAEALEQLTEIVGQRRLELQLAPVDGVAEREPMRVQRLAWKRNWPQLLGAEAVPPLADQGVPAEPGLNPDLVSLPGLEAHFEKRCLPELLDAAIAAHRLGALRIARMRPLLDESLAIPHEVIAPGAFTRIRMTVHQREIDAFRFPLHELLLQCLLRPGILCEDNQTRRVAIDSMYDERPPSLRTEVTFQLVVDGWLRALLRQRHRQQSCRLVDDQQYAIFIDDVERRGAGAPWRTRAAGVAIGGETRTNKRRGCLLGY